MSVQICRNGDLIITDVAAEAGGSVNDARIFRNSTLCDKFTERVLPHLPNGIILNDAGYHLLEWLLVPYVDNPGMTATERRYNKAHRSARSVIEQIIGILKTRWACLKELRFNPENCCHVAVVCCMLHNFWRHLPLNEEELNVQADNGRDYEDYVSNC